MNIIYETFILLNLCAYLNSFSMLTYLKLRSALAVSTFDLLNLL